MTSLSPPFARPFARPLDPPLAQGVPDDSTAPAASVPRPPHHHHHLLHLHHCWCCRGRPASQPSFFGKCKETLNSVERICSCLARANFIPAVFWLTKAGTWLPFFLVVGFFSSFFFFFSRPSTGTHTAHTRHRQVQETRDVKREQCWRCWRC